MSVPPPTAERLDLHLHPAVRAAVVAHAAREGRTLNDCATEAFCSFYGLNPLTHAVPRRPPGRKPGGGRSRKAAG